MTVTPQTNTTLEEIARKLRESDDIVLCGHVGPDGDCLGSQLTLYHTLKLMGKTVTCVLARDEAPGDSLSFMPGMHEMVPAQSFEGPVSLFVGVDVPNRERIGDAVRLLDPSDGSITLDHHASETTMCDLVYVDPDSASCSILTWEVVKQLLSDPPLESALCAFTGLVTDTGGFRFQNSDARAFSAAAELVDYGVEPSAVATNVFQSRTLASLRLEARILERMEIFAGGQGAISYVTMADLEDFNAKKSDIEPLIDSIRSLSGIRVACILREQEDSVRGSMRSKDSNTDVARIAARHGGGGHKAAAGFTLHEGMDESLTMMKREIEAALGNEGAEA